MDAKKYLQEALSSGKLHHSILLEGAGEDAVSFFAKTILCKEGCKDNSYLNELIRIKPEGKTIKISQIREMIERIKTKPFATPWRLVVIENAETLTIEAANALLKTLEEPPQSTFFLLITQTPSSLPSTIISRCLYLYWKGPKETGGRKLSSPENIKKREDLMKFMHNLYLFVRDYLAYKNGSEPLFFKEEELNKANFPQQRAGEFLDSFDRIYSIVDRANLSIARAYLKKILKDMGLGQL